MPDEKMIQNIVATGLTLARGSNAIELLQDAWSHTRNLRENGGCSDENLAVAEHYLYARYYVAENGHSGWAWMQILITGYLGAKVWGLKGILPESGKCKVTNFSRADADWSFRGSDDGLKDYIKGSKTRLELKAPELPL